MGNAHFKFWPKRVSTSIAVPETTLYENLEMTAKKYPNKDAIYYYGARYTYKKLLEEVNTLAGYLEHELHVKAGDKVLLFMQNAPQFVISYYAILRVRGIVVPVNPMCTTEELSFYVQDCHIKHALIGQELFGKVEPLKQTTLLEHLVVAVYKDYVDEEKVISELPPEVQAIAQ